MDVSADPTEDGEEIKHDGELDADEFLDSGRAPAWQKRPAGYVDRELEAAAAGPYVVVVYALESLRARIASSPHARLGRHAAVCLGRCLLLWLIGPSPLPGPRRWV